MLPRIMPSGYKLINMTAFKWFLHAHSVGRVLHLSYMFCKHNHILIVSKDHSIKIQCLCIAGPYFFFLENGRHSGDEGFSSGVR